jgi:hypothetical protein
LPPHGGLLIGVGDVNGKGKVFLSPSKTAHGPNSERDSIMPCTVNPVLKSVYRSLSIDQSYRILFDFHASNRRSLLSEFKPWMKEKGAGILSYRHDLHGKTRLTYQIADHVETALVELRVECVVGRHVDGDAVRMGPSSQTLLKYLAIHKIRDISSLFKHLPA